MSQQSFRFSFDNIEDAEGINTLSTALKNIDGVTAVKLDSASQIGIVNYEDTDTSYHAIEAALNTVDYITQPFPEDAPQNPDNL